MQRKRAAFKTDGAYRVRYANRDLQLVVLLTRREANKIANTMHYQPFKPRGKRWDNAHSTEFDVVEIEHLDTIETIPCDGCLRPTFSFATPCMDCVRARHRAALTHRCTCGRKRRESDPHKIGSRRWTTCARCLGTVRQLPDAPPRAWGCATV